MPPKIDIRVTAQGESNAAVVAAIKELGAKLDRLIAVNTGESAAVEGAVGAVQPRRRAGGRRRTAKYFEEPPFLGLGGLGAVVPASIVAGSLWQMRPGMQEALRNLQNPLWRAQHLRLLARAQPGFAPRPPGLPMLEGRAWHAEPLWQMGAKGNFGQPNPNVIQGPGFVTWPSTGTGFTLGNEINAQSGRYGLPVPQGGRGLSTVFAGAGGGGGGGGPQGPVFNLQPPGPGRMAMYSGIASAMRLLPYAGAAWAAMKGVQGVVRFGKAAVASSLPWNRFSLSLGRLGAAGGMGWEAARNAFFPGKGQIPQALMEAGITQEQAVNFFNSWQGAIPTTGQGMVGLAAMQGGIQWMPGLGTSPLRAAATSILGHASAFGMAGSNQALQGILNRLSASSYSENKAGDSALYYLRSIDQRIGAIAGSTGGPINIPALQSLQGSLAAGGGPGGKSGAFLQSITGGTAAFAASAGGNPFRYYLMMNAASRFAGSPAALKKFLGPKTWALWQQDPAAKLLLNEYLTSLKQHGVSDPRTQTFFRAIVQNAAQSGDRNVISTLTNTLAGMLPGGAGSIENQALALNMISSSGLLGSNAYLLNQPAASGGAPLNNPLNLKNVGGNGFRQFKTIGAGFKAADKNLQYYFNNMGLRSVRDIASEWVFGKLTGLTGAQQKILTNYLAAIKQRTGWGGSETFSSFGPETRAKLMAGMAFGENSIRITPDQVRADMQLGTTFGAGQLGSKPPLNQRAFQAEIGNLGLSVSQAVAAGVVPITGNIFEAMDGMQASTDALAQAADVQAAQAHHLATAWANLSAAMVTKGAGAPQPPTNSHLRAPGH